MGRSISKAAMLLVGLATIAPAFAAPVGGANIDAALADLSSRIEAQTLDKMQGLVARDTWFVTHGLLRREARRIIAAAAEPSFAAPSQAQSET